MLLYAITKHFLVSGTLFADIFRVLPMGIVYVTRENATVLCGTSPPACGLIVIDAIIF